MDKGPEARGRKHGTCREFQMLLQVECREPEIKGCKMSLSCPEPHEMPAEVVLRVSVFSLEARKCIHQEKGLSISEGYGAELRPPVTAALISFFLPGP